jgi:hypothetical protein
VLLDVDFGVADGHAAPSNGGNGGGVGIAHGNIFAKANPAANTLCRSTHARPLWQVAAIQYLAGVDRLECS